MITKVNIRERRYSRLDMSGVNHGAPKAVEMTPCEPYDWEDVGGGAQSCVRTYVPLDEVRALLQPLVNAYHESEHVGDLGAVAENVIIALRAKGVE